MEEHIGWRFVELQDDGQGKGQQVIILFTFVGIACDHRAQHRSKEVIHEAEFNRQAFFDDELKADHEYLGLTRRHRIDVIGKCGVQSQLMRFHEIIY